MQQKERTQWIEKAMNSLDGMQTAAPDAGLFDIIERRLNTELPPALPAARTIDLRMIPAAAACILLLITLNLFVLTKVNRVRPQKSSDITQLVNDYHLNESPIRYE